MDEMNVYIYGGKDRFSATEKIVDHNDQVTPNKEYSIPYTKGMLVIAFPNKDKDTELEFKYWIGPYVKPTPPAWWEFEGAQGQSLFYTLCAVAGCLLLCIICMCCYCCRKSKGSRVEVVDEMELGQTSPKGGQNDTSVQLEDISGDEEDLGAHPNKG